MKSRKIMNNVAATFVDMSAGATVSIGMAFILDALSTKQYINVLHGSFLVAAGAYVFTDRLNKVANGHIYGLIDTDY